jgi:T5SS/PEP-CTERM-associated repeat protein
MKTKSLLQFPQKLARTRKPTVSAFSNRTLVCLFTVLTFAVYTSPARATSTYWTNASSGDWFDCTHNWSNGCPNSLTDAYINDAGTAQINSSGASVDSLTLGQYSSDSGTVTIDGTNGGQLVPTANIYVGYQGTGSLTITNGGSVEKTIGLTGSAYIARSTSPSAASNGSVTVKGSGSTWQIGNADTASSRLFVSGSENGTGGTALLGISNGGTVKVVNNGGAISVNVGGSGTLTGNGTITTTNEPTVDVSGTLNPSGGTLTIGASGDTTNLSLESAATTECSVTPQAADNVAISGTATLSGRLSVTMTGTFTNGTTQYILLYAAAANGRIGTFTSTSIKYPTNQGFTPNISYDANHVYLNLVFNQ